MKIATLSAIAALALAGACASNTGLGDTMSGGAYGELSPKWEKAAKAEAKAQANIDKGNALIKKGDKQIKAAQKELEKGEANIAKGKEQVRKAERNLAKAEAERTAVEAEYKSRAQATAD